ncbi:serine/threonine-protein kinase RsbW/sigma-B regulation protein RsbU (phosphoserine phosphatase) [Microbispora rosea]|uniref:Serine/threonine-protein kinase RsbW/sigma-B regulation protein RsbU (Phosphoserine phosphatase) n=1 Tax=Microbispora rosea TaxID=58117 RepID=A0A1N7GEZ5_9ACTN|nr:PAS domain-containing protein [Microbispora rosea]GIH50661.1 hypothetical protein Mro03_58400 [Microbispora rosea subsp. rosea]SIS11066.1 serine/threonine-protein kinase RsbW/sigma-B regulation protein RsbU (phosphoserine phosphatase) [Microbispora rosea]
MDGVEDDFEELYEHAPCGYLSTLPDGTIVRVNGTLLELTGYGPGELTGGMRIQNLLAVGDRIFYETHFAPLLAMQSVVARSRSTCAAPTARGFRCCSTP